MSEIRKFEHLLEVEDARPESSNKPAAGPIYELAGGRELPDSQTNISSLFELFTRSAQNYPDNNCLGSRSSGGEFEFLTYAQVEKKVQALASALAGTGLKKGSSIGVFGANCIEWMVTMQACNRMSYICVPLYDTLGEAAVEFIIKHSGTSVVVAQGSKLSDLAKVIPNVDSFLKQVVYWGDALEEAVQSASAGKAKVTSYSNFEALGEAALRPADPPSKTDICTIMYTSGTTGDPKGVVIKHENILAEITALQRYLIKTGHKQDKHDVFLSYLPLAHIFDRAAEEFYLSIGASIGYWRGDVKGLTDDIATLKPTLFCGVPRIFERIQMGVQAKMEKAGWLTKMLFQYAVYHKRHYMNQGFTHDKASPLFDALVFGKIKAALGGRCKIIISGGAPLSPHVEDFLKVCMCAEVVQGYGLTETMAGAHISLPSSQGGNVGPPLPGVQLRLESCMELGYDANAYPPRGEVLLRGGIIFGGYLKLESTTKEVLEADGWFHTGDIGELLPDGSLKIIDRKKNIFKLSQGEYIAVEKVEAAFGKSELVDTIWVYGNSFHSCVVAVVVPNAPVLMAWAKDNGITGTLEEVCTSSQAKDAILKAVTKTGRDGGLKGFEIIKALHLEPKAFDVDRGLITPTFKLKRPQLLKYYQKEVDAMYSSLG